jgi:hypothetical protein
MGMTRATGGPVRCPWCSRPVSDGPGSPESCPSCGVPLSATLVRSTTAAPTPGDAVARSRKSQRLRALATVLALTAAMLVISAIGVAAAVVRSGGSDGEATGNLESVLRAAATIERDDSGGNFSGATPASLMAAVPGVSVVAAGIPSGSSHVISMQVFGSGGVYGWYGAVRSKSGHCFAAATVDGSPRELTAVLPGNCTGDAARASLMPLTAGTPTMGSVTTGGSSAGIGSAASG